MRFESLAETLAEAMGTVAPDPKPGEVIEAKIESLIDCPVCRGKGYSFSGRKGAIGRPRHRCMTCMRQAMQGNPGKVTRPPDDLDRYLDGL